MGVNKIVNKFDFQRIKIEPFMLVFGLIKSLIYFRNTLFHEDYDLIICYMLRFLIQYKNNELILCPINKVNKEVQVFWSECVTMTLTGVIIKVILVHSYD